MADKNKTFLLAGLSLIVFSFFCVAAILYVIGQKNQTDAKRVASLQVELSNLMVGKGRKELKRSDAVLTEREPIDLDEFLAKAETIYGPQELQRKEGIMWIDRKSSQCMINLGVVNGLTEGSRLKIYDGDKTLGEVSVQMPLDVISYVQPVDKTLVDFSNDYYRVSLQ
jgi:hypothetical protein